MGEFKGIEMNEDDAEALRTLQSKVKGFPGYLFPVRKITWDTVGFTTSGNRVTGLGLYDCGLTSLPGALSQLSNLRELKLGWNKLTSLPETFSFPPNLQTLSLATNRMTSLPDTIGKLSELQTLYVHNNQLTSLPEMLSQLSNLQILDLSNIKLTSLPETLGNLSNLRELKLSDNQLTSLPETLGKLSNLQSLDLSYNKLTSLPETLGKLSNLYSLDLSECHNLRHLPESSDSLLKLENSKVSILSEESVQISGGRDFRPHKSSISRNRRLPIFRICSSSNSPDRRKLIHNPLQCPFLTWKPSFFI